VNHAELWPRLPAVVADGLWSARNVRTRIEGAIAVKRHLDGAGGDFELMNGTDVAITGTATSQPLDQPYSSVQLSGTPDLTAVSATGVHSIWLQDGPTGNWYPIVGVNRTTDVLTVVGEVRHNATTAFRIGRTRLRYVDLHGPVFGEKFNINRPPAWSIPSTDQWDQLHIDWEASNAQRVQSGLTPIAFVRWLADPANFVGGSSLLSMYGLGLEPTFHLRNTSGISYRWSPPLFTAYPGTATDTTFAGYRWKVLSWREIR